MSRIRIRAILAGLAVDLIGTVLFCVAAIFLVRALGRPPGDALLLILNLTRHVSWLLATYWIGLAFTFLGAYVTARLSKPNFILNTLLFGVISTVPSLFSAAMYPAWYTVLCVTTIVPLSLAVGYFAQRDWSNQSLDPTAGLRDDQI